MATFRYKALASSGELLSGEIEATDSSEAINRIQDLGHLPISATEAVASSRLAAEWERLFAERGPTRQDMALLTQQMASLIGAGLTVDRTLDLIAHSSRSARVQPLMEDLLKRVRGGTPLSEAMVVHQRIFPRFYVNTVRAAERGGFLDKALGSLATFTLKAEALRESVRSALIYPTLLLVVASLTILLILTVVLPQFRPMFADTGVQLALPARIVMGASGLVQGHVSALLAAFAAVVLVVRVVLRRPDVIAWRDRVSLRAPILRDIIIEFEAARFARTLGLLLGNGVELPPAMTLAGSIIANREIGTAVDHATARVKEGQRLAETLEQKPFPASAIALIRVGEETGRLPDLLTQAADLLDREVQRKLERMMALLVPVLTIVLGLIIAAVVASIFTALVSVNDLVV